MGQDLVLVLVSCYKSVNNDHILSGFIHARVKEYQSAGIEVHVFECCPRHWQPSYIIDGVSVTVGNTRELSAFIDKNEPGAVCPHFISSKMIKGLKKAHFKPRLFIFVHGIEALHWYQCIFPKTFVSVRRTLAFLKGVIYNVTGMCSIRQFLRKREHGITLIGVSQWMLDIAVHNYHYPGIKTIMIPNVIRTDIFQFVEKPISQRLKVLVLRSFDSNKYAPDIIVKVIKQLSKNPIFEKLEFHIVGEGILWERYTSAISDYPNVSIKKGFVSQHKVAELHKEYGIFLCPTRQDAQGVSMCEAMASGLIPITLFNTAIPEFVPSVLQCQSVDDLSRLIINIANDSALFSKLSALVSSLITEKCSPEKTTQLEITLFNQQ